MGLRSGRRHKMQVAITARHIQLTQAMKEHVEERVERLERLLDPPVSANVVLLVEKHRQTAELTLHGNGAKFHGEDVAHDLYVAIDNSVEKVRRQIEKHKDRTGSERIRENQKQSEAAKSQPETGGEPVEDTPPDEDLA